MFARLIEARIMITLIHVVLFVIVLFFMSQAYSYMHAQNRFKTVDAEYSTLQNELNNQASSNGYLDSATFVQKYAKQNSNMKVEGEQVIEIKEIEGGGEYEYFEKEGVRSFDNYRSWRDCITKGLENCI